jgi:hypothetical protein
MKVSESRFSVLRKNKLSGLIRQNPYGRSVAAGFSLRPKGSRLDISNDFLIVPQAELGNAP